MYLVNSGGLTNEHLEVDNLEKIFDSVLAYKNAQNFVSLVIWAHICFCFLYSFFKLVFTVQKL
jgi:hypothetical protein